MSASINESYNVKFNEVQGEDDSRRQLEPSPKRKRDAHNVSIFGISCMDDLNRIKPKHHSEIKSGTRVKQSSSITFRLREVAEQALKKQEEIEDLIDESVAQLEIQQQACATLQSITQCGRMENSSGERVEVERQILLAGERSKIFRSEAEKLVLAFAVCGDEKQHFTATLFLSDIILTLANDLHQRLPKSCPHFLCLIREKQMGLLTATTSLRSSLPTIRGGQSNCTVDFSNRFTLADTPCSFQLVLEVYQMIENSTIKPTKCSKTRKIKRKKTRHFSSVRCTSSLESSQPDLSSEVLPSAFHLVGQATADKTTMGRQDFLVENMASNRTVQKISMTISVELEHNQFYQGYLSVYTHKEQWRRRWFALRGSLLQCWLYPDQPDSSEPPLSEWDLNHCCIECAQSAGSEVCAWQNAFILPLATAGNSTSLLLAADSHQEKTAWLEAINSIVSSIIAWR